MTWPKLLSRLAAAVVLAVVLAHTVLPFYDDARARRFYRFEADLTPSVTTVAQLYYDAGRGLNEADSARVELPANQRTHVSLPIVADSIRTLRFDPLSLQGSVIIENPRLVLPGGRTLRRFDPAELNPEAQIESARVENGHLELKTTPGGNDPNLGVPLGTAVLALPRTWIDEARPALWRTAPLFAVLAAGVLLWTFLPASRRARMHEALRRLRLLAAAHPAKAIAVIATLSALTSSYPVVFCGASYVSPNYGTVLLYDKYPTLPQSRAAGVVDNHGADVGAIMWQHVGFAFMQARAVFTDGEWPLWNRYNSAGTVLLGQGQSMFGDPLHWVVLATGGAAWAWDVKYLLAKFLLAFALGLSVWQLTRRLGPALLIAFGATFAGFFLFRANHPAFFSFCYGPLILLAWLRLRDATTRRATYAAFLLLVLACTAVLTSGTAKEAYLSLLTLNFAGAAFVLTADAPWSARGRQLGLALLAGLVFLALTAPVWTTFAAALGASYSSYHAAAAYQIQPSFILALFDEIFFRPFTEAETVYLPSGNFLFLGGALLFLAHPRIWRGPGAGRGLLLAALLPALFVFPLIPKTWITAAPFLGNVHHIANSFGLALLHLAALAAGLGFAAAADSWRTPARRRELAGALVLLALLAGYHLFFTAPADHRLQHAFLSFTTPAARSPFVWASLGLLCAALVTALVLARRAIGRRHLSFTSAFLLAASATLLLWRHGLQLRSGYPAYTLDAAPRVNFTAPSPAVQALIADQREPGRALGLGNNLFPGWTGVYTLEGINSPDALMNPFYRELQEAFGLDRLWDWRLVVYPDTFARSRPFLNLLNVRHVLDLASDQGLLGTMLTPVRMADLDVYRNDQAWPRAFFTDRVARYRSPAEFAQLVRTAGDRPLAAVAADDPAAPTRFSSDLANRTIHAARNYRLTSNTTRFTVDASSPGVVALTETWLAGDFRVTLNGQPAPYFRLNHAFKGVVIDQPGTHEILVEYRPRHFNVALTLAALASLSLLGAGLCVYRFPGTPPPA